MRALVSLIAAGSMTAGLSEPAGAQPPAAARPAASSPAPAAQRGPVDPRSLVAEIRRLIGGNYVLPDKRPALDAVLAEGLRSRRYDTREPAELARRINADLERVGRDRHLNFRFNPERAAILAAASGERPDMAAFEADVRRRAHGIAQLRLLPGNVRYMELTSFEALEDTEAAIDAAMRFLTGGDAVIIDLRANGGGSPRSVHHIISHFMEADRPLVTFYRGNEASPMMRTMRDLNAPRAVGKPLYVLIGPATGSAAEEFVGHVSGYRLGELVGANTSGGAFMNQLFPLPGGFVLSVSTGRTVLASTGRDWEGTGFAPTIPTEAEAALDVAHAHALRRLAAAATGAEQARLQALADEVGAQGERRPSTQ
ncbi:MAG TPA: S41 family peptidase [Allosphingosinicella sp.]|jgi:hypothetical protein